MIVAAAPAAIPLPTSVEPVNAILATSGCSTRRAPQTLPGPGDDVEDALRQARLERDPLQLDGAERGQLGRLEDDGVAGGEGRRDLPGGDHEGEVPGHDQADDAEWLAEGHVDAAGDRDRLAQQPLGGARVVAEGLDHHPDLAAGVADRLARIARLQVASSSRRSSSASARRWMQGAAIRRCERAPGREGGLCASHGGVDLGRPGPGQLGHHLLGRRLEDLDRAHVTPPGALLSRSG